MNGTTQQTYHEEEISARIVRGGSLAESITGGAGIVLAIIGLANIMPQMMLPIATIALGAALLFEGGAIASRFSKLLTETAKGRFETSELGVGLTAEVVGGLAGVILGILTLLGVSPSILMPVAVIVFGGTLLFGSGVTARLNNLQIAKSGENEAFREVAREAVSASAGVQLFLGLAAVTLGIIAVAGISWMTLNFVALLCVGVSDLLSGSAIAARMMSAVRP